MVAVPLALYPFLRNNTMGLLSTLGDLAKESEAKAKAKLLPKSGWMSRKLWIFAGIAFTLIWLGRGNLVVILDGLIFLTGVYLVAQVIQDVGEAFATAWVKREQLRCETQIALASLEKDPK